jgi:hypothetical protein
MIRYWYQVLPSGKPNSKRLSAYVSVKVCSKKLVINDPKLKKLINMYGAKQGSLDSLGNW